MMGGLCQQAWEGEEDGDEGSGTNRTAAYVTVMFGVFNEPLSSCSLATELLLLAGEAQHKHIKTSLPVQNPLPSADRYAFVWQIKRQTPVFWIFFRLTRASVNSGGREGRACFHFL